MQDACCASKRRIVSGPAQVARARVHRMCAFLCENGRELLDQLVGSLRMLERGKRCLARREYLRVDIRIRAQPCTRVVVLLHVGIYGRHVEEAHGIDLPPARHHARMHLGLIADLVKAGGTVQLPSIPCVASLVRNHDGTSFWETAEGRLNLNLASEDHRVQYDSAPSANRLACACLVQGITAGFTLEARCFPCRFSPTQGHTDRAISALAPLTVITCSRNLAEIAAASPREVALEP